MLSDTVGEREVDPAAEEEIEQILGELREGKEG